MKWMDENVFIARVNGLILIKNMMLIITVNQEMTKYVLIFSSFFPLYQSISSFM